jgi:hypothetical protein
MSIKTDNIIKDQIHGQQSLARALLAIIPLVPEYFKPFNGERVKIASGADSAPLTKAKEAFYAAAAEKWPAQVFVRAADYSLTLHIKIDEPDSNSGSASGYHSVNYFESYNYIGNIKNYQTLEYSFDPEELVEYCNKILAVTPEAIKQAAAKVKELKAEIDRTVNSQPYAFKELIV